jgi:late competence protein required for DNA uptake (superfamily II DNA/RNA helicase)
MSETPEGRAKNVNTFMRIMEHQPLSLALVVMNFVLLSYLFYSGSSQLSQRKETAQMIVKWQEATDQLLSQCVGRDILQMVLNALERERKQEKPVTPTEPK